MDESELKKPKKLEPEGQKSELKEPNYKAEKLSGSTPRLHLACRKGDADEVKTLLAEGHDVNEIDESVSGWPGYDQRTPLMTACFRGHDNCVDVLLSHGCNVDQKTERGGKTALMIALEMGHHRCAELIYDDPSPMLS